MQALQNELDSLRADNIKLYEKIKFLQSYPGRVRRHGRASGRLSFTGLSEREIEMWAFSALQAGGSDDTVMRYSSQYEERLDPFASFSRKVKNKPVPQRPASFPWKWRRAHQKALLVVKALLFITT